MKRSGLKRKTPLPPRAKPLARKTPLKKVSANKRKERRETDGIRHANLNGRTLCEGCGERIATVRHEIPAGAYRHRAVYEPMAQMDLCENDPATGEVGCHEKIQGLAPAAQAALKTRAIIWAINRAFDSKKVTKAFLIHHLAILTCD